MLGIVAALGDEQALRQLLERVGDDRLSNLLDRMLDYRERFTAEHAAAASDVFLDLFPRLKIGPDFRLYPPEWALAGVLRELLRQAAPDDRAPIVEALFDGAPSLTARWYVIAWFGATDEPGQHNESRVLSPEATETLDERLREQIVAADPESLKNEPQLLTLLGVLLRDDEDDDGREIAQRKLDHDDLFIALLVNAMKYADWWKWLTQIHSRSDVIGPFLHRTAILATIRRLQEVGQRGG